MIGSLLKNFSEFQSFNESFILKDISYSWKAGIKALDNCSLTIPGPGLWMIVGGNGSGKSTLFRLISGIIYPHQGSFHCSLKIALMLQNPDHQLLLPSCGSDLLLSLPSYLNERQRNDQINFSLTQVGLGGMEDRPIHTLSGGQKQRLALAGALSSKAQLLLLDEPTALLDPISQNSILKTVKQVSRQSKDHAIAALWITHRLEELKYCDGAAIMHKGSLSDWMSGDHVIKKLK